jgi:hypothetical protein
VQAKSLRVVFDFAALANVAVPLLSFSSRSLDFEYFYHPIIKQEPRQQLLRICNTTRLPLNTQMHTTSPFTLSKAELKLEPGEEAEITVTMDHDYRNDLVSHKPK